MRYSNEFVLKAMNGRATSAFAFNFAKVINATNTLEWILWKILRLWCTPADLYHIRISALSYRYWYLFYRNHHHHQHHPAVAALSSRCYFDWIESKEHVFHWFGISLVFKVYDLWLSPYHRAHCSVPHWLKDSLNNVPLPWLSVLHNGQFIYKLD